MTDKSALQWVDKYRPQGSEDILGNTDNVFKIKDWLQNFKNKKIKDQKTFKNAILISGPPGIGKTSAAHILLKEAGFDTIEFNASELRTSKELCDKLHSILNAKSIKMMFNKSLVTGIIMDEIDGIENKKECTSSDLIDFFNFETNNFYSKKANKKILKKNRITHINKNPIICICNSVDKNLSSIMKEVIHFRFQPPTDTDIYKLLKKINDKENLGISDVVLQLIVPHCQSDFRRTVYVLELLAGHVSDGKEITNSELINIIDKLGSKDIDLGLFQAVDIVFNDRTAKIDELLTCYYADQVFVPSLIHENFMNYIDYNTNNTYSEKLDLCIEFYNYYIDSQQIKSDIFGHWELADYVGVLSTAGANVVLNKAKIKKVLTKTSFEKSSLVSKYNYRYYNLKYINQLSKSLQIDIKNFQTLSLLVAYCVFLDKPKMDYMIQKLYNAGLNSKEFKKIVKLSLLYQKYSKKFTKKLQNEIDNKFKKLE
tara:strand:+ start:266 stop:1717 length:1452 start_codon:yes stop_codon:yes gene_type:complete